MTSQAERGSPPGLSKQSRVRDDRAAFAEMFEAHAQHIFDYCCSLLGDRARATSATQVTLIAAHSLADRLKDQGRMRAFVLALGRRECLSGGQGVVGTARPDATRPGGSDDFAAALAFVDQADDQADHEVGDGELALPDREVSTGSSLRAILQALSGEDRETLDLLYRHDVSITDLAPLLGVPPARVPAMRAAAKSKFAARAAEMTRPAPADAAGAGPVSPDVRAEQLSAVRLVSLPDSVWRRTSLVVTDPGFPTYRESVCARAEHLGPDGFPVQSAATPSNRKLMMASALMAGLLLAPAAAGGAVYATLSNPAHVAGHHHNPAATRGSATRNAASRSSAVRDSPAASRTHSRPRNHASRGRRR